ncbi:hypothetical protein LXA43DRAFT_1107121 [Ganoderma leucocontextum]|nr:hypothetical protein LXA43DRAFT_1107121 [Ganoderma leucocontextum]
MPTLADPLVKVPLLLLTAYLNYEIWNFPTAPSPANRKRQENADPITRIVTLNALSTKLTMVAICGFCTAEATVILGQSEHSFPLLDRLIPLFAPNSAAAPSLQLYLSLNSLAGILLIAAGGVFRLWAMRTLGKFFVMEVSLQKDHRLATRGPYAIVRHPSYIGYALIVFGDAVFLLSEGSYLAAVGVWGSHLWAGLACLVAGRSLFVAAVLMPSRAGREDAVLREEFGREWEAWAERTPYKLVPYVF